MLHIVIFPYSLMVRTNQRLGVAKRQKMQIDYGVTSKEAQIASMSSEKKQNRTNYFQKIHSTIT